MSRYSGSERHMSRARELITRGVGSAMREAMRPTPLVIESASGSTLTDVDGNDYIDYICGFGPILLGHRPPEVIDAVSRQLERGVLFGAQHPGELELAERIVQLVPSAEMVALSNTGSEAIHAALRFARVATGKELVVKFEGQYHGWLDPVFASGPGIEPLDGSDAPTHTVPGLPAPRDVLVTRWNDAEALGALLAARSGEVAAVIMEPVACNFGNYEPLPGYLDEVRRLCDQHDVVLVFDEVITGFRLGLGGAQARYGVTPDLTILAKAIASGFPISAVAGRHEVMSVAHGEGPVRHIGTYNGNAVSVAAANATLALLEAGGAGLYSEMDSTASRLANGLNGVGAEVGAPLIANQVASVVHLLWGARTPVRTYADAYESSRAAVADFASHLLGQGIAATERGLWFVTASHTDDQVDRTIAAARGAAADVAEAFAAPER
ncbi:MAG: aspartate aminotransferase family protein [Solirubrobacterales bacterium]